MGFITETIVVMRRCINEPTRCSFSLSVQGDDCVRDHLPDRRHWQCHCLRRDCASLDNAHGHQLLPVQSGRLRSALPTHG